MLKQFHVLLHDALYQSSQIVSHGEQLGFILITLNIRLLWLHNRILQDPSSGKNICHYLWQTMLSQLSRYHIAVQSIFGSCLFKD